MAGKRGLRIAAGICAGLVGWIASDLALAAPSGPPPGFLGAPPIYREIKDWVIACDNTRACVARFVPAQDGDGENGYFSISRRGGPAGDLVVEIQAIAQSDDQSPDPRTVRLDGHAPPGAWAWTVDPKAQSLRLTGAPARAFVRVIIEGDRLAYADRKQAYDVSLSGLKAALLAMDEDQGRLDGETALVHPGPGPASATPAALPVPQLRAVPAARPLAAAKAFAARVRRSQAAVLKAQDCDPEEADQDKAWALDRDRAVVVLGCGMGAYQGWVVAFVAPRTAPERARRLILPGLPLAKRGTPAEFDGGYTEGEWDPKRATFSSHAKGRGPADCGESVSWVWDGQAFRLSDYNSLNRCSGGPPGDWPTLYRTRVVIAPAD